MTTDQLTPNTVSIKESDRRAALQRLGALVTLTPPAVLTLLLSPRASADSLGLPPPPPPEPF